MSLVDRTILKFLILACTVFYPKYIKNVRNMEYFDKFKCLLL